MTERLEDLMMGRLGEMMMRRREDLVTGETERLGDWGDEETRKRVSLLNYSTANMRFCLFQG